MQESVPNVSAVQATFVATLVDEWHRLGLRDAVICPGSRSTPLSVAFAQHGGVAVHVRIDERSAAFFALGRALRTRRPVAIVVTSGTAAAEVHAAVAEADLAGVALMVLTADRPPELHGVGAPQTIDQQHLYGNKVRLYEEPGVARLDASTSWRPLAGRLWRHAAGVTNPPGPVHLNAAFVEPLLSAPLGLPPSLEDVVAATAPAYPPAPIDVGGQRVLCVVGAGTSPETIRAAHDAHWVVLGDATAAGSLAYADPLVRHDEIWSALRPDVIVRLGGVPASKFLAQRLATSGVAVIALEGARSVADPDAVVTRRVAGTLDASLAAHQGDATFVAMWREASASLGRELEEWCDGHFDEILVARLVVRAANAARCDLVVGSSMPIRDVEWWGETREGAVYANRGANGIDGVVSTFLGVAQGSSAIGLVGDVTMLHDVSALVEDPGRSTSAVLVVSDNAGGGIFSFLAQARQLPSAQFDELFATPRRHDLAELARAFGHHGETATNATELRAALDDGLRRRGLSVVVARVPERAHNVVRHEELNALVARWWSRR